MKYVTLLVMSSVLLIACKSGEPSPRPEQSEPRAPEKAAPPLPEKAPPPKEMSPVDAPVKTALKASAKVHEPAEGMPKTFELALDIREDNTVNGSVKVQGDALTISGRLDGTALRLWALGPKNGMLRGGYFIGELKDGKAEGTFALSGNGGAPALKGTWGTGW